jgi:transcriptional regulator with PAS, ATPase and Fis domain
MTSHVYETPRPSACLRATEVLDQLVGRAPAFLAAISTLPCAAKSNAAVLITGETGSGKELVARAIHHLSDRSAYPMLAVNCGSLPDTLLEEELFGHQQGAFTGALRTRRGLIAEADQGTLFLDEVDMMPAKAQAAILRVLQEGRVRMIGSNIERIVDVRIVAASNEALHTLVRSGRFRTDLYYRLCVFSIHLPALRERSQDIELLAKHFLQKHSVAASSPLRLSLPAVAALNAHDWPATSVSWKTPLFGPFICAGTE